MNLRIQKSTEHTLQTPAISRSHVARVVNRTDGQDDALGFLFVEHAEHDVDHARDSSRALRYMSAASSPMCLRS